MSPQRRTALVSVAAAAGLIALKLATGLATGSLGLISEAVHSGTDLVAALLTFFAVGVAAQPADRGHPYGHGKAEHLTALAEATILVLVSLGLAYEAIRRLSGASGGEVDAVWYAFLVIGVVIAIDASRAFVSARAARRYGSAALAANALHFASDLAGSWAVLLGLGLARAGYPKADAAAALFVSALVLLAAGRLIGRNVNVLMDRVPAAAEQAARDAIGGLDPAVDLRRLRMREAGGRQFADLVIAVTPGAPLGQAHAAADAVEDAVRRALPGSDVVVHVEPAAGEAELVERMHDAAIAVPRVREVHNVTAVATDSGTAVSLHLKLPGELTLEEAHSVASEVERAIAADAPEVTSVQTHIEPLAEQGAGTEVDLDPADIATIVRGASGREPRALRFLETDRGVVVYLTLAVEPDLKLAEAHALASSVEERIRRARPDLADVIVHTEP